MVELLSLTTGVLCNAAQLLKNPELKGAVSGFISWLGGIINKKSAKEKLVLIEQGKQTQEHLDELQIYLKFVLDENEELQKQLSDKIKELQEEATKKGIPNITKTNTQSITGNNSIGIQDVSGSKITINK